MGSGEGAEGKVGKGRKGKGGNELPWKLTPTQRTDRACRFSRLLRHAARKRSGSILSTMKPARGPDQEPAWGYQDSYSNSDTPIDTVSE